MRDTNDMVSIRYREEQVSDFVSRPLNDTERLVAEQVTAGAVVTLAPQSGQRPRIRAALIRHLLLGPSGNGASGPAAAQLPGVRIRGATIDGMLDLADCARPGSGLPTLELADCDIAEPIDLTAARVARLSLAGSRFTCVTLREAEIDGPFDFSGARGYGGGECRIDATGALINGEVRGLGARLQAPAPRPTAERNGTSPIVALSLAGARLRGSLRLAAEFSARGGISLDSALVHGDVWLADGTITAGENDAFRAQNAVIDGVLMLRNCDVHGVVWLHGVRTGGILQISDVAIHGAHPDDHGPRHAPREQNLALIVADAEIGASIRLTPGFVAHGLVSFATSKIRGDLNATGAQIDNRTEDGRARAVNGTNADIGANLLLDEAVTHGRIDIAGAKIGGKLSLLAAALDNYTTNGKGQALEAINVSVGGNAEFGRTSPGDDAAGARVAGAVNLTGARIGGDLSFTSVAIDNLAPRGDGNAIVARQVQVQASILLIGKFSARGALLFTGATIGRDLACQDATLCNPERSAIYAKDIEVGDDIKLHRVTAAGTVRFERAAVAGSVHWEALTLSVAADPHPDRRRYGRLEFMHARIGSTLKCAGLIYGCPCLVDLTGLRVATIDLSHPHGWGPTHCEGIHCPVRLDGMVYERIEFPGAAVVDLEATGHQRDWVLRRRAGIPVGRLRWLGPGRDPLADRMLDWVLRDSESVTLRRARHHVVEVAAAPDEPRKLRFHPQPYRQLTQVLRAQGHESSARRIAVAEQWATPRDLASWLWHSAFGVGFGFGLRPFFAVTTLILYVLLGTGLAMLALSRHWMIETPQIAATAYTVGDNGLPQRAFVLANGLRATQDELPCHDLLADSPLDAFVYAADTVLPFIPLHQETKCELSPAHTILRFWRAAYTVIGWVVTSLALLTFSGLFRRSDSDPG